MRKSCLAGSILSLVLVLLAGAARATTSECPAKTTAMDDIITVLSAAPTCERAMSLFEACEYSASGDAQFGAVVQKKCEDDFLDRLKAPRKLIYQRELRVCDRKYQNEHGTMYVSFTAFCRAEVAQRYSRQTLKVDH